MDLALPSHVPTTRHPSSSETTRLEGSEEDALDAVVSVEEPPLALLGSPQWEAMLKRSIRSIVSIAVTQTRSFDTEKAGVSEASGFIVDAERGFILTNRHVVTPGPVMAEITLWNHEEVQGRAVYHDPVHDFGIYRIDPKRIKYTQLAAIPLRPDLARVGLEVRVVGNDAGEKLSILAGTLARLDRAAPKYGSGRYNDFNTVYYQAASMTSGGSSGSPVLDVGGHAVALNAGGRTRGATSYFLPLERVVRALTYLQKGEQVPRGTLQTEFSLTAFDRIRRLGLKESIENEVRRLFPEAIGMLVVHRVLPNGPGDKQLSPGDILLKMNHQYLTTFAPMEELVDSLVGQSVSLQIQRGEVVMDVVLDVQDLHSITPSQFVEFSGGVFHPLSYQMARSFGIEASRGMYVADPGYAFSLCDVNRDAVITEINGEPTLSLDDFVKALSKLYDGQRVPVRFFSIHHLHRELFAVLTVERHWSLFKSATRNDITGLWDYTLLPDPPAPQPLVPSSVTLSSLGDGLGPEKWIAPSFVTVSCNLPSIIDGASSAVYAGLGLIINVEYGLVLTDRNTVPTNICDIRLTFGNSLIIPGRIVYMHPIQNMAVVQYDSRLIQGTNVRAIEFASAETLTQIQQGSPLYMVCLARNNAIVSRKTSLTNLNPMYLNDDVSTPRFRTFNSENMIVDVPFANTIGGVLIDAREEHKKSKLGPQVVAIWTSWTIPTQNDKTKNFYTAISVELYRPYVACMMDPVRPRLPVTYALDSVEFFPIGLVSARGMGLSEAMITALDQLPQNRSLKTCLSVLKLRKNSEAATKLREGDIVLEVNRVLVCRFSDLMTAVDVHSPSVHMKIMRGATTLDVDIPLSLVSGHATTRLVGWAGATFQEPYLSLLFRSKTIPSSIYCAWTDFGSPAQAYGLYDGIFITEVNGVPVRTLDDFLLQLQHVAAEASSNASATKGDKEAIEEPFVRLKIHEFDRGVEHVIALRTDTHYWPCWSILLDPRVDICDLKAYAEQGYKPPVKLSHK